MAGNPWKIGSESLPGSADQKCGPEKSGRVSLDLDAVQKAEAGTNGNGTSPGAAAAAAAAAEDGAANGAAPSKRSASGKPRARLNVCPAPFISTRSGSYEENEIPRP
jgi:hypothetical protein